MINLGQTKRIWRWCGVDLKREFHGSNREVIYETELQLSLTLDNLFKYASPKISEMAVYLKPSGDNHYYYAFARIYEHGYQAESKDNPAEALALCILKLIRYVKVDRLNANL